MPGPETEPNPHRTLTPTEMSIFFGLSFGTEERITINFGQTEAVWSYVDWPCVEGVYAVSLEVKEKRPLILDGQETYALYTERYLICNTGFFANKTVFPHLKEENDVSILYLSNAHTEMTGWEDVTRNPQQIEKLNGIIKEYGSQDG